MGPNNQGILTVVLKLCQEDGMKKYCYYMKIIEFRKKTSSFKQYASYY